MGRPQRSSGTFRWPRLPWVIYNLFRLIAVVILTWTLVVQFIIVARDINEYSKAESPNGPSAEPSSVGSFVEIFEGKAMASTTVPSFITPASTAAMNVVTATPTITATATDVEEDPDTALPGPLATAVLVSDLGRRLENFNVDLPTHGGVIRRADDDVDPGSSYVGLSSIPDQAGGIFFVVISRLLIVATILLLLSAQVGLPETFLYERLGWLGPQSTPIFCGFLEMIIAIETLSIHARPSDLLSAWLLFGVGSVNVCLAAVLLFLGRRLPKTPPPPLYFSLSQRVLYWQPPPRFYRQLFGGPEQPVGNGADPEKTAALPPSNAHEVGLSDSDSDEIDDYKTKHSPDKSDGRRLRGQLPPEQDVRKGGYPTFSGMSVTQPGRQVPAGRLEDQRGGIRFIQEEEDDWVKVEPAPRSRAGGTITRDQGRGKDLRGDDSARNGGKAEASPSRSKAQPGFIAVAKPPRPPSTAQSLEGKLPPLNLRRPPNRSSTADSYETPDKARSSTKAPPTRSATSDSIGRVGGPVHGGSKQARAKSVKVAVPMTPIGEESSDDVFDNALKSRSSMKSVHAAAADLGPRFPLPPTREDSQPTPAPSAKSRRESSAMSLMSGASRARTNQNGLDLKVVPDIVIDKEVAVLPKSPRTPHTPHTPALLPRSPNLRAPPKSPRIDQIKGEVSFNAPLPPLTDPSPILASSTETSGPNLTLLSRRETMLRSSLAPETRSPKTATARTERVAQGVRFDLASPPSTGDPESEQPDSPPRSGFRIPGTKMHINLFGNPPSTPGPGRRISISTVSSVSSDEDTSDDDNANVRGRAVSPARPESFASVSSTDTDGTIDNSRPALVARGSSGDIDPVGTGDRPGSERRESDERAGLPRSRSSVIRPKSVAVLGGSFLDGGKEMDRGPRDARRHSSFDSS